MNWRRRRWWHIISIIINIDMARVINISMLIFTSIFFNILSLYSLPIRCQWPVEESFEVVERSIKLMLLITWIIEPNFSLNQRHNVRSKYILSLTRHFLTIICLRIRSTTSNLASFII
jgi:hypothetical protein